MSSSFRAPFKFIIFLISFDPLFLLYPSYKFQFRRGDCTRWIISIRLLRTNSILTIMWDSTNSSTNTHCHLVILSNRMASLWQYVNSAGWSCVRCKILMIRKIPYHVIIMVWKLTYILTLHQINSCINLNWLCN